MLAATTLMAFSRPYFLRLFMPRDLLDSIVPSFKTMGVFPFFKFMVATVFVHQLTLLSIELLLVYQSSSVIIESGGLYTVDLHLYYGC